MIFLAELIVSFSVWWILFNYLAGKSTEEEKPLDGNVQGATIQFIIRRFSKLFYIHF